MAAAAVAIVAMQLVILGYSAGEVGAQSQRPQTNISLGSSLIPEDNAAAASWASPSGRFAFGFYPVLGGYGVGVWLATAPNRTVVWMAWRDDPPITDGRLTLSADGSLIWHSLSRREKPITSGSGTGSSAAYASMLDSGEFAIYNSTGGVIWSTFGSPTDTIVGGQRLLQESRLLSSVSAANQSTGKYQLLMQRDSNLVACLSMVWPVRTLDAYWATNTYNSPIPLTLRLTTEGHLYLEDNGRAYLNITQASPPPKEMETYYRAVLDADGVFRLYSDQFNSTGSSSRTNMEWASITEQCQIKGHCGPNSYCSDIDEVARCVCPPGFDYVDRLHQSLGCSKAFTGGGCGGGAGLSMETMDNKFWADQPSSVTSSVSADQCMETCQEDCFCDVALFKDGSCSTQMLPLTYGGRAENTKVFIKVRTAEGVPPVAPAQSKQQRKVSVHLLIVVCVAFTVGLAALCALSGFLVYWLHSVRCYVRALSDYSGLLDVENAPLRAFTYVELTRATGNFKEELGKGAFGTVFKGAIGEKLIAVKRLDDRKLGDKEKEFQQEVRAIGRTHHRNLVRLLGFCNEGSGRLLVYEYMSHGCLANLLFKTAARPRWKDRLGIALDVARGLHYLHDECEARVLHCDIKPQNILMDEFGVAKIADFGLAKLLRPEQTRTLTQIRGTRGYVAPEWFRNLPVTVKADVYSFGVVLLEVAFCRRNVEPELAEEEVVLTDWANDCIMWRELPRSVDGEEVDGAELERVVKVGLWCIQEEPACRPSMKDVLLMLEGNKKVAPPPPPASFS